MRGDLCATAGRDDHKLVELTVSVEAEGSKWRIRIDERELLVDAVRIKPGTWSLLLDGRSVMVDVDETRQPHEFHTHQAVTPILLESAQRKKLAQQLGTSGAKKSRGETIKAPIAGRVVNIQVELGQSVEAGTCVAILEAMKMENEIKCKHAGIVASVDVGAGDNVDTGAKLLSLKPKE
jgi:biotin carboxyl carrier protein